MSPYQIQNFKYTCQQGSVLFYKLQRKQSQRVQTVRPQRVARKIQACSDQNQIAQQLQTKENELKNMFQSGGKIPKASEVAAIRQEIKELRLSLSQEVNENAMQKVDLAVAGTVSQVAAEKARKVLMELQNREEQNPDSSSTQLTVAEKTELEALEIENTVLRSRANKLLLRQLLLEELLQKHKEGSEAQPSEAGVENIGLDTELGHALQGELGLEREQDKTAVMQAPSYY
eukprot:TRINITY_DN982_c0_g1_i1.p3 TRINITY_DN982_c0_g1~~TRINITY_DN982_c0_g1_i1.p3  ORF type:complete len:231 (-),score=28.16 TRINITY_DN982_c0_g1_i1:317-1009(-)